MIYYILFGTMLAFCIVLQIAEICNKNTRQLDKSIFWTFAVILIVMTAIRDNVGLDFEGYKIGYTEIHESSLGVVQRMLDTGYFEPLYNLLNILAPSFRTLIIICAGFGVLAKAKYYNRTDAKLICLILYYGSVFLYYDMGIMRQGISLSIVWFSLKYVKDKDIKRFLIWIFVATMFHVTAVMALPIYFLGNRRYNPRFYFMWLAIGLVLNFAYDILIRLIARFGGSYVAYKLNAYTTYMKAESNLTLLASTIIMRLGILMILWRSIRIAERCQGEGLDCFDNDNALFFNAYYISIVEMIAFAPLYILATRGIAVLYFCYIPLFSSLISDKKITAYKRLIFFAIAITFVTHTFLNTLGNSAGNLYIPYSTFLEGAL